MDAPRTEDREARWACHRRRDHASKSRQELFEHLSSTLRCRFELDGRIWRRCGGLKLAA